MHAYMRAIGLSEGKINENDIELICESVYDEYDHMESVLEDEKKVTFMELSKEFGRGIGLKVLGEQDGLGFHRTSYFPYVKCADEGSDGSVGIQAKTNGDSFIGVCNDGRVGAPLIFSLQNPGVYLRGRKEDPSSEYRVTTTFAALSLQGRIILPAKSKAERMAQGMSDWAMERQDTVELAKMGDEKALQMVTLQNLDLYSMVQQRLSEGEDIFSIVDTYFIPYGMESDQYHMLANIDRVVPVYSMITREMVWKMDVECSGLRFTLCINADDLEGYPSGGMRFRGDIWLQGNINFMLPTADHS